MGEAIMCEYIRKQAVLNMIDNAEFDDLSANTAEQAELFDKLHYAVNSMESVDAVEVIRCMDCKWCSEDYDTDGNVPYWTCKNWDCGTDADGFCHEAERKTDG